MSKILVPTKWGGLLYGGEYTRKCPYCGVEQLMFTRARRKCRTCVARDAYYALVDDEDADWPEEEGP